FERLPVTNKLHHAEDLSSSKLEDSAGRRAQSTRYRCAALLSNAPVADAGDDPVASGSDVLDLDAPVSPGIFVFGSMATEGLAPNIDTGAWVGGRVVPLNLGIEELLYPVVALGLGTYRLQHRSHDLHVLVRHCLLLEAEVGEGASAV